MSLQFFTKKSYNAEYASDVMSSIPIGYIDKTICGCGITTVALESDEDCIIAAPSIELIKNKVAQYTNERCSYKVFGVYGSISREDIDYYLSACSRAKIMVTYDSLWKTEYLLEKGYRLIKLLNVF